MRNEFLCISVIRVASGPRVKIASCKSALNSPVVCGLTICLWLGQPWFNYWFSFTLAYSRISHEYSSLFIIVIDFYVFALIH